MQFQNKTINLQRYPQTTNRSLRPWSAADELLLAHSSEFELEKKSVVIAHDSFGALATALHTYGPHSIINNQSQLKATKLNLQSAGVDTKTYDYSNPTKLKIDRVDIAFMKVPKSAELFQLYIQQLFTKSHEGTEVLCGFMTRNFTPRWMEIASHYFEDVSQSLAAKKARLLILKSPKKDIELVPLFHTINNDLDLNLKQYAGVFSASKVDIATQLLLETLPHITDSHSVLDLACGNGVIAAYLRKNAPHCSLSVLDDSHLAISSAKLNLTKENVDYHWSDSVKACKAKKFDYILCNPPFHFEYENTIEISLNLFREAAQYLADEGQFYIVANTHLNYRSHLIKLFTSVSQVLQSGKYEVIMCEK
ncbi:methyltransferase [Bacteroidia bacterium]|nr:methyltransferase [Bacteroidia bacterium]